MPLNMKNGELSSLNELFAMKKNLALDAKFEHRRYGIIKEYFNKKDNLQQEIRDIYNELKVIKSSTGYSLDQVRSADKNGRSFRKPNAPTIYFPPIGVRLVKKYVGLDVKRQSIVGHDIGDDDEEKKIYRGLLNRTFGIGKIVRNAKKETLDDENEAEYPTETPEGNCADNEEETDIADETLQPTHVSQTFLTDVDYQDDVTDVFAEEGAIKHALDTKEEQRKSISVNSNLIENSTSVQGGTSVNFLLTSEHSAGKSKSIKQESGCNDGMCEENNVLNNVTLETTYNLTERRSSRSTFRTRNSARLPSQSSYLSEYNLGIVSQSKDKDKKPYGKSTSTKEKIGLFYLDYGDGKLHDSMEIPKIKDCSRPWCNPHCKTCRNRTTSGPCFVLIPADENFRKRKLPKDKRDSLLFPVYQSPRSKVTSEATETVSVGGNASKETGSPSGKSAGLSKSAEQPQSDEDSQKPNCASRDTNVAAVKDIGEKLTDKKESGTLSIPRKSETKKGYSKQRINELSQPRGGPPAEVRFSKMSLKIKQEQLVEKEKMKALTEFERDNLSFIQGKITMFLAFLNQQESTGKPPRMVDLPIREEIKLTNMYKHRENTNKHRENTNKHRENTNKHHENTNKHRENTNTQRENKSKRKRIKHVQFSPRLRSRLLS